MRWLFSLHNPETNLNFGWEALDEVKRRLLTLWNTYRFFVTYAVLDGWTPDEVVPVADRPELDRWVLARLNAVIGEVRAGLDRYDSVGPARAIEHFIEDLSTWYVRRSRRRFWRAENDADKLAAYATLWEALAVLTRLMAPFVPFLAETLYQNLIRGVIPDAPTSVHLTDYPVADESLIDEELLRSMAAAQQVVALGHAARERAKLNVRQPLATIFVTAPDSTAADGVLAMRDLVLDELNVKQLQFAGSGDRFVTYSVRPNLPVLGPRYGKRMPAIRHALESLDPEEVAAAVERGESVRLHVDGEEITLQPSEVLPSAQQRDGFAAMANGGYVVALDTELTPQLRREGLARQVVRRLNDWRKNAGYNIEDRIRIVYEASPEMAETIEEFRDYIRSDTLATSLEASSPRGGGYEAEARLGDEWLRVEMHREAIVPAS
jgi:isoleucyl-tRNA synthetase